MKHVEVVFILKMTSSMKTNSDMIVSNYYLSLGFNSYRFQLNYTCFGIHVPYFWFQWNIWSIHLFWKDGFNGLYQSWRHIRYFVAWQMKLQIRCSMLLLWCFFSIIHFFMLIWSWKFSYCANQSNILFLCRF